MPRSHPPVADVSSLTQEIQDTLGVGGLTQQVRATDQQGMNLLMHAARYATSVEVFSSALKLVKALTKQEVVSGLTNQESGVIQLRQWDTMGMNLLHHGAEGCAEEMLSKVTYGVLGTTCVVERNLDFMVLKWVAWTLLVTPALSKKIFLSNKVTFAQLLLRRLGLC